MKGVLLAPLKRNDGLDEDPSSFVRF
ncbi:gp57 [Brochothrix phage A9]|uniref:Gp57 n=1 Tax=Brochothrix phage A9 TaxID=857312 RepID=D9J0K4_9CAUD|nr:gp57 [Brochothrix phage A9]ADJ53097.1 gp57 [Brochothrix phage A9]